MSRKSLLLLPLALALALVGKRRVPGPLAGGVTLLPSGWRIHPAGRQVRVGTLPLNLLSLADGSVLVTDDGWGENGLIAIDPATGAVTWRRPLPAAWLGLAHTGSARADTAWVSGGATNRLYRFVREGETWRADSAALGDSSAQLFAAGLAVVPGRALVAVVGNLSDSVYLFESGTLARRAAFPVGHRPYTVVADSNRLYVSNWGDSTVSMIDLGGSPGQVATLVVGPHPSALALAPRDLFVALAGANGVARLALPAGQVVEQLTVGFAPHAPTGSDPNALALSPDGRTLYVAMAGNNAVSVVRVTSAALRVAGLIPTGWYPTAVATSADGQQLYVANGRGGGSGSNADGTYIAKLLTGSVSIVAVPDSAGLARYTREARELSPFANPALRPAVARAFPPQLRHVVYVIRENRTYDQVLGDVRQGEGDAALAIFNDSVTPNAHAIARRWVLFDNFYVDGDVSADGHEWTDAAFAHDYNEKTWPQVYSGRRTWDLTSGADLVNPAGGYLWDAARQRGLWVVNFGEMTESDERDTTAAIHPRTNIAGLQGVTATNYPGFVLSISDTTRARLFADSVESWDRQGKFPDLVLVWLPRDHTLGRRAGRPTPRAMVADNDFALGEVVERLSRSPAWPSLALFAVEDDAQNGPDHVDAHRSVLLVASPYARRGAVDSTFYTTSSVVRSIGLILGLPPRSQYDAAATPLTSALAAVPDLTPFHHVPPVWPLDERTTHAFHSRIPGRDLAGPDEADETLLNWEIWTSVRPGSTPPPVRRSLAFPMP